MDLEEEYRLLSKCEDELICFVCEEWCKSPVRLNRCGHYFCSDCVPKNDNSCPKCKEVFFQNEVDTVHWYDKIREDVQYFKTSLEPMFQYLEKLRSGGKEISNQQSTNLPFRIRLGDPKSFGKNAKGESKLHIACKRKKIVEVKKLLAENVDINLKDYACWTPLHEAIQAESIEIVKELLDSGVLINSPGEFYVTPLHKAVLMENIAIIKLLVEYGADREAIDFYGKKPADCTQRKDLLDALLKTNTKTNIEKPCIFLVNKIVVYCHSIDEAYINRMKSLKNLKVSADFDIKNQVLTHLIVKKTHKVSLKILLSMLSGLIIVRQEWLNNFMKGILDPPSEPVLENDSKLSDGIKKAMINKLMNKPKLFDGINFYLEGLDDENKIYDLPMSKEFIKLLISVGGGVNLSRAPAPRTVEECLYFPYHATSESSIFGCSNIILFNDNHQPKLQYKMKELQHKSCKWLIDSVINFKLI